MELLKKIILIITKIKGKYNTNYYHLPYKINDIYNN